MLRTVAAFLLIIAFAAAAASADLVSMKLCPGKNYDALLKDCAAGKGLEGNAITVDPSRIGSVQFLTQVKTSGEETLYHVWIHGKSTRKVLVFDSSTKTLGIPNASDLKWLKDRNIEGAAVLVKMTAPASEKYSLRSSKTLTPAMEGIWKVQVYDATQTKALGEMEFKLGAVDAIID